MKIYARFKFNLEVLGLGWPILTQFYCCCCSARARSKTVTSKKTYCNDVFPRKVSAKRLILNMSVDAVKLQMLLLPSFSANYTITCNSLDALFPTLFTVLLLFGLTNHMLSF